MSSEENNNKFTWGDSVIVQKSSPNKLYPGRLGSVCGFSKVESNETAKEFECETGDWLYTIEFEDGSDIEIPECYLEKDFSIIPEEALSKYCNYFINGIVFEFIINIDWIEIRMKSSKTNQPTPSELILLKNECFSGKLILSQVNNIIISNNFHKNGRGKTGNIRSFEISKNTLKLEIEWNQDNITSFQIDFGQLWWYQEPKIIA